ncbi:MAG: energy transducer TonB [Dissulfurispiraceae bacterium]|jgi:periplasmic protein TonB
MNNEILWHAGIDSPWRRLLWILPSAFLIWGALLWGFGFLLEQVAGQPEALVTIDAQIIEHPEPIKHAQVLKQQVRKITAQSSPPQLPASIKQPTAQLPSQLPLTNRPDSSLSETNPPVDNLTASAKEIESGAKGGIYKPSFQGIGEAVTPPQFGAAYLNNPRPVYPASARRMGMEGRVMLKVLVSRQGTTLKINVVQSSGYEILDRAAAEAVSNWRFVPAKRGDSPVEEWVQVPVAFHIAR